MSPNKKGKVKKKKVKVLYKKTDKQIFNELKEKLGSLKKLSDKTGLSYYEVRKINKHFNTPKKTLGSIKKNLKKLKKTVTDKQKTKFKKAAKKSKIPLQKYTEIERGKLSGTNLISFDGIEIDNTVRMIHCKMDCVFVGKDGTKLEKYPSQTFFPPFNKDSIKQIRKYCIEFLKAKSGQSYLAYIILRSFQVDLYHYPNK